MTLSRDLDELSVRQLSPKERLREALFLYDEGVALQRQNFRRRNPHATSAEIDQMLQSWLLRENEA